MFSNCILFICIFHVYLNMYSICIVQYFIGLYFRVCIVLYCIGADIYPGGGRAKPGFCLNLLDPGDTTPRRLGHYFTIFKQIRDTTPHRWDTILPFSNNFFLWVWFWLNLNPGWHLNLTWTLHYYNSLWSILI